MGTPLQPLQMLIYQSYHHRSLVPHMRRVHYSLYSGNGLMLQVPAPTDHEWALGEDILNPVWSQGAVRPSKVADILDSDMHMDEQQDN